MKLEIKKKLADKWFSDLQILICEEFLKLEKNLSSKSKKFRKRLFKGII